MRLAAILALLALTGCVTVASVHVDGRHARTWIVPFGGVAVEAPGSDAVGVRQVGLGLYRIGPSLGLGLEAGTLIEADPASCGVAILDRARPQTFGELSDRSRSICLHHNRKETINETPLPSAGGDPGG